MGVGWAQMNGRFQQHPKPLLLCQSADASQHHRLGWQAKARFGGGDGFRGGHGRKPRHIEGIVGANGSFPE